MLRVFFAPSLRRPLMLASARPFSSKENATTSDEESARPLRTKEPQTTSLMDKFARKISQTRSVSERKKQALFNDVHSESS
jgi:hypothetical protein